MRGSASRYRDSVRRSEKTRLRGNLLRPPYRAAPFRAFRPRWPSARGAVRSENPRWLGPVDSDGNAPSRRAWQPKPPWAEVCARGKSDRVRPKIRFFGATHSRGRQGTNRAVRAAARQMVPWLQSVRWLDRDRAGIAQIRRPHSERARLG